MPLSAHVSDNLPRATPPTTLIQSILPFYPHHVGQVVFIRRSCDDLFLLLIVQTTSGMTFTKPPMRPTVVIPRQDKHRKQARFLECCLGSLNFGGVNLVGLGKRTALMGPLQQLHQIEYNNVTLIALKNHHNLRGQPRQLKWLYHAKGQAHVVVRHNRFNIVLKLRHRLLADFHLFHKRKRSFDATERMDILRSIANVIFHYMLMVDHIGYNCLNPLSMLTSDLKQEMRHIASVLKRTEGFNACGHEIMIALDEDQDDSSRAGPLLPAKCLPLVSLYHLQRPDSIDPTAGEVSVTLEKKKTREHVTTRYQRSYDTCRWPKTIWGVVESDVMSSYRRSPRVRQIGVEFKLKSSLPMVLNSEKLASYGLCDTSDPLIKDLTQSHLGWPLGLTRRHAMHRFGLKKDFQTWTLALSKQLSRGDPFLLDFNAEDATGTWYRDSVMTGKAISLDHNFPIQVSSIYERLYTLLSNSRSDLYRIICLTGFGEGQQLIAEKLMNELLAIIGSRVPPKTDPRAWMDGFMTCVKLHRTAMSSFDMLDRSPEDVMYLHSIHGIALVSELQQSNNITVDIGTHTFGCSPCCHICFTEVEQLALMWLSRYKHGRAFCDVSVMLSINILETSTTNSCKIIDIDFKSNSKISVWSKQFRQLIQSYKGDEL